MHARPKLIILDRDGVINEDSEHYIRSPDEWHPIEGSIEAIAALSKAGYPIVVATNQAGIAKKIFSVETLHDIHAKMLSAVETAGGLITRVFFCPHHPDDHCQCRKPQPGMLFEACAEFRVHPGDAIFIGDSLRDLQAATYAGCTAILVLSGNGRSTLADLGDDMRRKVAVFNSLAEFSSHILQFDASIGAQQ